MSECCGVEAKTPFCPQCGRKIGKLTGLHGLLQKCRINEKINASHLENIKERYRGKGDAYERVAIESKERQIKQWKAWGDELASLLAANEAKP